MLPVMKPQRRGESVYLYDFTSEERQRLAQLQQRYIEMISALDISEQKPLLDELADRMHDLYETIADEHFQVIAAQGLDAITDSAYREIDHTIERIYENYLDVYRKRDNEYYKRLLSTVAIFTDSGFLLHSEHLAATCENGILRHLDAADEEHKRLIYQYLDQAIANCPFVDHSDNETPITATIPEKNAENDYRSTYLASRTTILDLFSDELFLDSGRFSSGLVPLDISRHSSKLPVNMHGAINFSDAMKEALRQGIDKFTTGLTDDDKLVHEAIISHYMSGNFVLSYSMIYRAITGITADNVTVPDEWRQIIKEALVKFKATITIRYQHTDKSGNVKSLELDKPMITYIQGRGYLNNVWMDDLIIVSREARFAPPLLEWAIFNGNELDTRDITLLNIPGLNFTKQNRTLERALYDRLIRMSNETKRRNSGEIPLNRRTIRLDYLYSFIGYDGGDDSKVLSQKDKDKRRVVKDQVTKCLKHWEKKGLITGYQYIKEGKRGYTKIVFTFTSKGAEALKAEK